VNAALEARAWAALKRVPDPEIPVISVVELGIVRYVRAVGEGVEVGLTPTYSGCPATEVIRRDCATALAAAGCRATLVEVLAPAWTSEWISDQGRERLRSYGIAPPGAACCPRCGSDRTERLAEFGSTPCKALHRCAECREPFEQFKCV
jgi:ring-1,2-phenylacetyl-CoA epoxidase subunit PaaD